MYVLLCVCLLCMFSMYVWHRIFFSAFLLRQGSRTQYHIDTIDISRQMCEFSLFDLLEFTPSPTTTEGLSPTANATTPIPSHGPSTSSGRKRSKLRASYFTLCEFSYPPPCSYTPSVTNNNQSLSCTVIPLPQNEPPSVQMNGEGGVYVVQLIVVLEAEALSESNKGNKVTANVMGNLANIHLHKAL